MMSEDLPGSPGALARAAVGDALVGFANALTRLHPDELSGLIERTCEGLGASDVAVFLSLFATITASGQNAQPPAEPTAKGAATQPVDQERLDKEFTQRMTNVVMNGQYTVGNRPPKADKYTIVSVQKLKGDDWLFRAQVHFYEKAFVMPMIVPVKWAGDTAVISVTVMASTYIGSVTTGALALMVTLFESVRPAASVTFSVAVYVPGVAYE